MSEVVKYKSPMGRKVKMDTKKVYLLQSGEVDEIEIVYENKRSLFYDRDNSNLIEIRKSELNKGDDWGYFTTKELAIKAGVAALEKQRQEISAKLAKLF